MPVEIVLLITAMLAAIAGAILLFSSGSRERYRARMLQRLPGPSVRAELPEPRQVTPPLEQFFARIIDRAGYEAVAWHGWLALGLLGAGALAGLELAGPTGLFLFPAVIALLLLLWLTALGARRRRRVVDQLPLFLDHVIRAVRAGNSVEQGLAAAVNESDGPIREVFERVVRQVQLGAHLDDAVAQAALTYHLQELELLQAAISVNLRYGGAIRDILENVIKALRERDTARREFRAMTGETRLSAWILAILPISLAIYIVTMNPEYFMHIWREETGRLVMFSGASLQLLGVFLIWRMLRSI